MEIRSLVKHAESTGPWVTYSLEIAEDGEASSIDVRLPWHTRDSMNQGQHDVTNLVTSWAIWEVKRKLNSDQSYRQGITLALQPGWDEAQVEAWFGHLEQMDSTLPADSSTTAED